MKSDTRYALFKAAVPVEPPVNVATPVTPRVLENVAAPVTAVPVELITSLLLDGPIMYAE
jgi:hypothetical protein